MLSYVFIEQGGLIRLPGLLICKRGARFFHVIMQMVFALLCCWILTGCSVKHPAGIVSVDSSAFVESLGFRPVVVRQEFVVMVATTYGGCTRPGETNVSVSGLKAEIRPYNRIPISLWEQWCSLVLRASTHQIPLRFDSPGKATVRVVGRGAQGQKVVFERQVIVNRTH
jgi:hypothetical protein